MIVSGARVTPDELRGLQANARAAVRGMGVWHRIDDAVQDSALRVVEVAPRAPADPEHRAAWLRAHAVGGAKDGARRYLEADGFVRGRQGMHRAYHMVPDDDAVDLPGAADPARTLAVRRAVAAVAAMREPLPAVAMALLMGYEQAEIAQELRVSQKTVSDWRAQIRAEIARHVEMDA